MQYIYISQITEVKTTIKIVGEYYDNTQVNYDYLIFVHSLCLFFVLLQYACYYFT